MIETVEQVCNELPHFGTITQEGKRIEIWARPFRNQEEFAVPGIYCIENFRANKIYIGMSKNISNRLATHMRELKPWTDGPVHHNPEMYNDSQKWGYESFSFGVLETFEDNNRAFLLEREEEWIQYFENQSRDCIYNKVRINSYKGGTPKLIEQGNYNPTKSVMKTFRATPELSLRIDESGQSSRNLVELGLDVLDGKYKDPKGWNWCDDNEWFVRIQQVKKLEIKLEAAEKLIEVLEEENSRLRHVCFKNEISMMDRG